MPECQLGIEFCPHFGNAHIACPEQIPEVIQIAWLIAGPVAQGQQFLNDDFLYRVDIHRWSCGQVVEAGVNALDRTRLQWEAQDFVDRDVDLHVVRGGQRSLVAQMERVTVAMAVAVFAIEIDAKTTGGVDIREDFIEPRQDLREGGRTDV